MVLDDLRLALLVLLAVGANTVFWSTAGLARAVLEGPRARAAAAAPHPGGPGVADVAVLLAARDEAAVIAATIRSAARLLPAAQVHVVSDGSVDSTAAIAREEGAQAVELARSRGKAGALAHGLAHFALLERYQVVLFLDADTELADDYLETALPCFADPAVAVVAGRARTQWRDRSTTGLVGRVLIAHRERVYALTQWLVKFGQASRWADAVTIAPGFASLYRSSALRHVDLTRPGLVIEDFNATFEVHARDLGRIAFHPQVAVALTQDPSTLRDYTRQVFRWALGFWQTVRAHRVLHRGRFWVLLAAWCTELLLSSLALLASAGLLLAHAVLALLDLLGPAVDLPRELPVWWAVLLVLAGPHLLLTAAVAVGQRRPVMLVYAPAFVVLSLVDAAMTVRAFGRAGRPSSGRWLSPQRRSTSAGRPAAQRWPGARTGTRTGTRTAARGAAAVLLAAAAVPLTAAAAPPAQAAETAGAAQVDPAPTTVSLTFDDGTADQLDAARVMDAVGLEGTFYLITSAIGQPGYLTRADLDALAAEGHEIGGHTVHHLALPSVSLEEARRQVCGGRATLTEWGHEQRSFAYPYAEAGDEEVRAAVRDCGYTSARGLGDVESRTGCEGCPQAETLPPADPHLLAAPAQVDSSWTLEDLKDAVRDAEDDEGGLLALTFHRVCDGCSDIGVSPAVFAEFARWLADREASTPSTRVRTVGDAVGGPAAPVVAPEPAAGGGALANASLEEGEQEPRCWTPSVWGTNTVQAGPVATARTGSRPYEVTLLSHADGAAQLLPVLDTGECTPAATAGRSYRLSAWYRSTAVVQFALYHRSRDGALHYWTSSPWFPPSAEWGEAVWTSPPLPEDGTGLVFGLSIFSAGTLVTDDYGMTEVPG